MKPHERLWTAGAVWDGAVSMQHRESLLAGAQVHSTSCWVTGKKNPTWHRALAQVQN